jgi:hypothetical protein
VELPELVSGGSGRDAAVRLGPVPWSPAEPGRVEVDGDAVYVRYDDVGVFRLLGGREVTLEPAEPLDLTALRVILTGPILGLLLHQRGVLVLHASTVVVRGSAVAFLGGVGAGKSTTAAAFEAAGHSVLSDDLLALQPADGSVLVLPGFPQLKLSGDAVASLGSRAEALERIHPRVDKLARRVSDSFEATPRALVCAYVLADGAAISVTELPKAQSTVELVRNAYVAAVRPLARAAWFLERCSSVADAVPVKRLDRPRDLRSLPGLVEAVAADVDGPARKL